MCTAPRVDADAWRVDPYGTLELSSDEMPQFLSELNQLFAAAVDGLEVAQRLAVDAQVQSPLTDTATGIHTNPAA